MQPLVFVKIGGSLITDKTKPFSVKYDTLKAICQEVKLATKSGKQLIIGHGAGSFGHVPAKKYQTHQGIINATSYRGIVEVADIAAQLNRIVVRTLIDSGVNALTIHPLSTMVAANDELQTLTTHSLEEALRLKLVPVVYGDQILDIKKGCTIFSTERILHYIALALRDKGYVIDKVIHCGESNGVYDEKGEVINEISSATLEKYMQSLGGSSGVDVTGGMLHKVQETLNLANKGIEGMIIHGLGKGSLAKAVSGKPVIGTRIIK